MIQIGKITIYVEDQEQAKDFWINKVGFVLKFEQPMGPGMAWIEVGPENDFATLVLYSKALMKKQKPENVAHPTLLFSTPNIEETYERLKNNGVKVDELQKFPYGSMFTFYDQDGNQYLLREDK